MNLIVFLGKVEISRTDIRKNIAFIAQICYNDKRLRSMKLEELSNN